MRREDTFGHKVWLQPIFILARRPPSPSSPLSTLNPSPFLENSFHVSYKCRVEVQAYTNRMHSIRLLSYATFILCAILTFLWVHVEGFMIRQHRTPKFSRLTREAQPSAAAGGDSVQYVGKTIESFKLGEFMTSIRDAEVPLTSC